MINLNKLKIIELINSIQIIDQQNQIEDKEMSKAGFPSTTGNPSGGGRDNNPPRSK